MAPLVQLGLCEKTGSVILRSDDLESKLNHISTMIAEILMMLSTTYANLGATNQAKQIITKAQTILLSMGQDFAAPEADQCDILIEDIECGKIESQYTSIAAVKDRLTVMEERQTSFEEHMTEQFNSVMQIARNPRDSLSGIPLSRSGSIASRELNGGPTEISQALQIFPVQVTEPSSRKNDEADEELAGRIVNIEESLVDLPDIRSGVQVNTEVVGDLRKVTEKASTEISALTRRHNVTEFNMKKILETVEELKARDQEVQAGIQQLAVGASKLEATRGIELKRLAGKMEGDIHLMNKQMNKQMSKQMSEQRSELEHGFAHHVKIESETWSKKLRSEVIAIIGENASNEKHLTNKLSAFSGEVESSLIEIKQEFDAEKELSATTAKSLRSIKNYDIARLQRAVSNLDERIRQKDETFFSAKCLSCNRVFNECERHGSQHDLAIEKSKKNLLKQLHRKFAKGQSDQDLRMISVRVGESKADGMLHIRDEGIGHHMKNAEVLLVNKGKRCASTPRQHWRGRSPAHDKVDYQFGVDVLVGSESGLLSPPRNVTQASRNSPRTLQIVPLQAGEST